MIDELLARTTGRPGLGRRGRRPRARRLRDRAARSRRRSCPAGTASTCAGDSSSAIDAPVWVDNDVNLLALGERARQREDEQLDLIYCKVGSGIGAGLLSQGRIHRGANGAAGDIGHVRVRDSDALCRCGKIGCLEAVAGGWALVRDAEVAIAEGATAACSAQRARDGEPLDPRSDRARGRGRRRPRDLAHPALRAGRRRVYRRTGQHVQPRHDRHRRRRCGRRRSVPRRGASARVRAVAASRDARPEHRAVAQRRARTAPRRRGDGARAAVRRRRSRDGSPTGRPTIDAVRGEA